MKVAIPVAQGNLCLHFGHCEEFAVFETDGNRVTGEERHTPPNHAPGVLPEWLKKLGVDVVIAGGMGMRAQQFFNRYGIEVLVGAEATAPRQAVEKYLQGTLQTGENICDH
ncbi:MAG TPA: ATPase [Planctomycetes bacterium]|mgnify:CR=1 FL=1|nr:ATPase [Planctomycetota bacterium]